MIDFLVTEKNFSEQRIRSGIEKLRKCRNSSVQGRLTSFFGPAVTKKSDTLEKKRKAADEAKKEAKKKTKAKATTTTTTTTT